MPAAPRDDAWWTAPPEAIVRDVASSAAGLTNAEAARRLAEFGANRLADSDRRAPWRVFIARFRNPLVLVLLAASVLSGITGDLTGCLIIASMVLLSVTIDTVQEVRAGRVADRLKGSVALHERVLRDATAVDRPLEAIVPGDVVLLAAGDLIPADCLVLDSKDCFVQQSLLSGASYPV